MADAIISVVLARLTAISEDKIRGEVRLLGGVKKEVLKLSKKLETIRNVLEDAERRGVKEKSVRGWLKKLEDTAYEMDDILDEWNYYAIHASPKEKEKVRCSIMPSSCLCFKKVSVRRDTAKKIQNVKESLDEILEEKIGFNFLMSSSTTSTNDSAPQFETTSSIDVEKVEGQKIEKKKDDIVRRLLIDGGSQILSIVGMGGIGKTTLAQLVYNDSRVKDCFELTIWICVSDPFHVAGIARKIVEIVKGESPPCTNNLELLLQRLRDCISGKKFLLVLDDVWSEDHSEWEPLKINLKHGAPGSKILVTTRNGRVAIMMGAIEDEICRPTKLTDEECWSLLCRVSLPRRSREERREFEEVGKELASRCKGLPLAVNVLGSVLQFKNSLEEWEHVLESEIWDSNEAGIDIYPHLLLSYKDLSPPLKLCFSYCAVYPKDTRIKVESLIKHWMALGYLGYVSGNPGAELIGRQYFNNLAMRSLFLDFKKDDSTGQIRSCKMHDIVHDFAQFLRSNARVEASGVTKRTCQVCNPDLVSHVLAYRTLFRGKQSPPAFCDCLTSLRVLECGFNSTVTDGIPQGVEKLIHLRWLRVSNTTELSNKEMKTICKLYYLQTLSLESCDLQEIPHEIGNLVHLRHLTLSGNEDLEELPDNMFNLIELQTLLLRGCYLKEISSQIGNLVHLRHIDLSCNKLEVLPKSMYRLVKLQTLLLIECSLKEILWEIGNLVELRNLNLSHNRELEEVPGSITKLIKLRTLSLRLCSLKEIPQEIGNLVKLRYLDLRGNIELKELPRSISRLVELQTLTMEGCKNCRLQEGLVNLNGIRSLDEFHGGSGFNRFELLKNLNSLSGSLRLYISLSSNSSKELVEDARKAEIKKKIHLRRLVFSFIDEKNDEGECSSSSVWVDLIEALKPNQNLQTLSIISFMGWRLPHWISSLNLVRQIEFWGCNEVLSMPPMGKLPFLERLRMSGMKELKVLGVKWLGIRGRDGEVVMDIQSSSSSVVAFPKLKQLTFNRCPKWSEWEDITAEEEESSVVSVMPCLTQLELCDCKGLNVLPHRLLRKASSLQSLDITLSPALIQCYGDKDGSPWRSISQNNPQLQLHIDY